MQKIAWDKDLLDLWKLHSGPFPSLSKPAEKWSAIPAMSGAPSEKIFSLAESIISKEKNSLKLDSASCLLVANSLPMQREKTPEEKKKEQHQAFLIEIIEEEEKVGRQSKANRSGCRAKSKPALRRPNAATWRLSRFARNPVVANF